MDKNALMAQAAAQLRITDAQWFINLIRFESDFNPLARNPYSGARGLIQIMPNTALAMFGLSADELVDKYSDFESQLFYVVVPYLERQKPFPTMQSLYMSVFFPVARNVPPDTTFRDLYKKYFGADWEKMYTIFARQNSGILTVQDYIDRVNRTKQKSFFLVASIVTWVIIAAVLIQKRRTDESDTLEI